MQQLNLAAQVGFALRHFGQLWVAIARWAAFDNIGNVDVVVPRQPHGLEHVVQQLAGLADKRLTAEVFILAGRFANDQPVHLGGQIFSCRCLAHTKHCVLSLFAKCTGLTGHHGLLQSGPIHRGNISTM